MHSHHCHTCGTVWSHSDASFGDQRQHSCPRCGVVQWFQMANSTYQRGLATQPRRIVGAEDSSNQIAALALVGGLGLALILWTRK